MRLTLRAIRINNGWTIEEMAKKIGVSVDTLRNYEIYKTYPDIPIVERILQITNMKYDDIIFLSNNYGKTVTNNNEQE